MAGAALLRGCRALAWSTIVRFAGGSVGFVALATAMASPAQAGPPIDWRLSLPSLDADRFVGTDDFTGPVLVNFWGIDCPPCVAELPRLQRFAIDNPHWTVLLVATDAPIEARRFLQRQGITLTVVRGGNGVATLMRRAGEKRAGLPFSVAARQGTICRTHRGEVLDADLQALRRACESQPSLPPGPPPR